MDGVDADQLLKKADMALYAAKNGGGGDHRFFALEMEEAAQERRALELDLREALASDQFQVYFQPLVDLRNGRVTTCEALLRWKHPTRGMVPPSVFIPIAEETGLIIALGEWALLTSGTMPRAEVTERLLLEDNDGTLAAMEQLKNLGVGISLDDFGTGYSSLNYLRKFPFQKIKIDQSFIRGLGEERDAQAIIGAVASLGASLDKTVVAEGIETEEQLKQVKTHGCHEGQGHFFGEPMPADIIRARLETSTSVGQLAA
jgi:EAL domain-containing protein (putative c-di-GMP-specific phosphodiesterase class I)